MRRRIAVALVVMAVVGACSPASDVVVGAPGQRPTRSLTDVAAVHIAGDRTPEAYDSFLADVIDDLAGFWEDSFPTVADGRAYRPLDGGVWPVWPEARGVPGCGSRRTRSTKRAPLPASRMAAVATATMSVAPAPVAIARKSLNASIVCDIVASLRAARSSTS